jgi:hypothetical protein
MHKLVEAYLKGAMGTTFTRAMKEGYGVQLGCQLAARVLFPAAPRVARVLTASAVSTAIMAGVLTVRGLREERPLVTLVAEANERNAKGLVRVLLNAQLVAEKAEGAVVALGMALRDARYGLAAAGGVSPVPDAVEAPVNVRVPRTSIQEN